MDVLPFPRLLFNQFTDVMVALVAGDGSLPVDGSAVVFAVTVPAGHFAIGKQFPKQREIIIVKILTPLVLLLCAGAACLHRRDEGMACLAEYVLVINDLSAVLIAVLIVTEKTVPLLDKTVFKGFSDQRGIMAIGQKAHLVYSGAFGIFPGDGMARTAILINE